MPGVPRSAELRAQAVAAVMAGMSLATAARHFGVSKPTMTRWMHETRGTDERARDLGDMIVGLIAQHIVTLEAQLQAAARPEWLEKQPAAELAQLVSAERDTVLRLLAGLHRTDPDETRALDAPATSDPAAG